MGEIAPEERPVIGSLVNEVRDELENLIEEREMEFKTAEIKRKLEHEKIDVTMPGKKGEFRKCSSYNTNNKKIWKKYL